MRLDLFSLKLFVDIVEARSIGKGATKNCIAMSAASKRMSDLEQKLGAPLLLRQSRGVVTTTAGETLYKGMTDTLSRLAQLAADVGSSAQVDERPVRVLASHTSLAGDLPAALKAFAAGHPGVSIELDEQSPAAALQAVSRGDADVGLVAPIVPYPANVLAHRFGAVRHVVVVPAGHALAAAAAVTFDRVVRHDVVSLEHEGGWDLLLRKAADERPAGWRVRARLASFDGVCRMVGHGLGVAIVPAAVADQHATPLGLQVLALDEPWANLPLDVCVRDGAPLATGARLLVEHLCRRAAAEPPRPVRVSGVPGGAAVTALPVVRSAVERPARGFADSAFSH